MLGSSGSVVPLFERQIKGGGPVTITHAETTRYFMTIPEAAQLVIQSGSIQDEMGLYVLDMGEPIKILDLAKKMIILSGFLPATDEEIGSGQDKIKIKTIGLRHGEKLHEELSYGSQLLPTQHPRIHAADEASIDFTEFDEKLVRIMECIRDQDEKGLHRHVALALGRDASLEINADLCLLQKSQQRQ